MEKTKVNFFLDGLKNHPYISTALICFVCVPLTYADSEKINASSLVCFAFLGLAT